MQTLSIGSYGADVALLQSTLIRAFGHEQIEADGIFGPSTQSALTAVQIQLRVPATGIADEPFWAAVMPYMLGVHDVTVCPGDTWQSLSFFHDIPEALLKAANPNSELMPGDVIVVPANRSVVNLDIPYSSTVLQFNLLGLKKRYPFLKLSTIGKSVLGRNLYRVILGSGSHQVCYNASHHANEWITTPMMMHFIESLCRASVTGERVAGYDVSNILCRHTYDIIPMVNPDGVDLVTRAIPTGSDFYCFAKERCEYFGMAFPDAWKANAEGTDLNLNYPAKWEQAKEIKYAMGFNQPAPRDFVGTAPLCAPEAAAMVDYTRRQNPRLTLSYHTQGEVIYWQFADYNPPQSQLLGRFFASLTGYELADTPFASGNAGYKDWFIQSFNRPGYTIEAGLGTNPLPLSQLPKIINDNMPLLLLAAMV